MKSRPVLLLMACFLGFPPMARAQGVSKQETVWRLNDARHAIPTGPGRLDERVGALISDPLSRQIRFDAAGHTLFVIGYDDIETMHYEQANYPRRFLWKSSFYLTFHYKVAAGQSAFETIRLLSESDALAAVGALEGDTGRAFDRSPSTQSFLGIPIRAGIGARIAITDQKGEIRTGTIARLSPSSLALDESAGVRRVFEERAVRQIRLRYSPKHDATVGFATGAVWGALAGAFLGAGAGSGCAADGCHVASGAAIGASAVGGIGAVIGMTVGAIRYPFNGAFDVYRSDTRPAGASAISVTPQIAAGRSAVILSVSF